MIGKFSTDPAEIPGVNSGIYYTETARATQEQGGDIWQFELNSVLSESWLLNVQLGTSSGFLKRYTTDKPDTVAGHYNADTELYYNAYPTVSRRRASARRGAGQRHLVRRQPGRARTSSRAASSTPRWSSATASGTPAAVNCYDNDGNPSASWEPNDLNGDGFFNEYIQAKLTTEDDARTPVTTSGELYTVFVQDGWRITPNLTLKPGIRLDRSVLFNALDNEIANMDMWQPRVGLAWDITGNGKHVVRGSVGRFMDPTTLGISSFASGVPLQSSTPGVHHPRVLLQRLAG